MLALPNRTVGLHIGNERTNSLLGLHKKNFSLTQKEHLADVEKLNLANVLSTSDRLKGLWFVDILLVGGLVPWVSTGCQPSLGSSPGLNNVAPEFPLLPVS